MAHEKEPSIYQDRGAIGSARELDEYGVWVKSEPQDLADSDKEGEGDFSLDMLDDLPEFSVDLESSSDFSADQDFALAEAEAESDLPPPEDDFNIDAEDDGLPSLDSGDQPLDLDGFSLDEDDSFPDFSFSDEDMALPDEISPAEEPGEAAPDDGAAPVEDEALPLEDDALLEDEVLIEDKAPVEEAAPEDNDLEIPVPDLGDADYDEISLEDLLGEVADDIPDSDMPAASGGKDRIEDSSDQSTQLLMRIAEELSSIRAELSALKREFSSVRAMGGGNAESRGFFNDTANDDKIALTGDELNNILNTAEFTEESGINAMEGASAGPDALSPETASFPEEEKPEEPAVLEEPELPEEPAIAEESALLDELADFEVPPALRESGPSEEPAIAEEPALLDELADFEEPAAEESLEIETLPELEELEELPTELPTEIPDDAGFSLADLPDDNIAADLFLDEDGEETGLEDLVIDLPPEEEAEDEAAVEDLAIDLPDIEDLPLDEGDAAVENSPDEEAAADSGEPDISFDASFSEDEAVSLENFDEDALDLTGALIEEPDLGAEIQENPIMEPAPDEFGLLEEGLGESAEDLTPELIELPGDTMDFFSAEEFGGGEEIAGPEEGVPEIPAADEGIGGEEDLDQIIPEGFVVADAEDEAEPGGIDSLEEVLPLEEIPEDAPPENRKDAAEIEDIDEPEVSALPGGFKTELKQVLSYMDQLLESLPEEKIEEFARSEYFDTYKKLFKELGLI
ncbi:MAG: hypothetical protein LBH51_10010 [Treponema sp.]|jgi:hypothetical protein|nr:hypothetical protein [Treponema sp.]